MKKIKITNQFLMIMILICFSFVSCKKQVSVVNYVLPPPVENNLDIKNEEVKPELDFVPNYEILKQTDQERTDGGLTFYIIIHPLDFSNDVFIGHIKNLVKKIVTGETQKENVTIEIFDSMNALDIYINDKNSTASLLQTHHIAKYIGESQEETYQYTLHMFPNATKANVEIEKYIDKIEFNPYNW